MLQLSGDTATHAASALRRVLPFLGSAEFQELCGDLLATVGLRAASWQQVVMALGQRGGDKVSCGGREAGFAVVPYQRLTRVVFADRSRAVSPHGIPMGSGWVQFDLGAIPAYLPSFLSAVWLTAAHPHPQPHSFHRLRKEGVTD